MNNKQVKNLCLDLLRADTEEDVVTLLKEAGFWNNPAAWRPYGDHEGNFATIGNQQSRPEAALVEKIINSVDARLMNACLEAGINPESANAPLNIWSAVDRFFPGTGGSLQHWAQKTRRDEAEHITLAATGMKRHPCITITDKGEGQVPARMSDTFMSIDKKNKLRIPFVQGKFNMGGTGVLKFCGNHCFQLTITRRNPELLTNAEKVDSTSTLWSFTITRRELPKDGAGAIRNSVFTYLAPLGADSRPNRGDVLRFQTEALPLMPLLNDAYVHRIEYGSTIKLYNYDMRGFSSHICMPDGLLYRLEVLLPDLALPVNLHECRDYRGDKERSFVTPLAGLTVRLEEGKGGNVEQGFPDSVPFQVCGENMVAKIYAFKDGRAKTYTTNQGVIFTINGQTHGILPRSIFSRPSVKLGRLKDSLLLTIDCSDISVYARENLFMNSRDRLSQHRLRKDIEAELVEILAKHPKLKQLANERHASDISERLSDTKPLEEVLKSIFKSSPSLNALFRTGQRLSNPHNRQSGGQKGGENGTGRGNGKGRGPGLDTFVGRPHPTYFRFYRKKDGEMLERNCEYKRRCRLTFETDVENEYFKRPSNPGWYEVEVIEDSNERSETLNITNSLILHNGLAHWSLLLPEEVETGQTITLQCTVADDVNPGGFTNIAKLTIQPKANHPRGRGKRKSSTSGGSGENPVGIELPDIKKVREADWKNYDFDERSACKIIEETDGTYTFFINVDNLYLRHEMKSRSENAALLEAKFVYGNVLVSLALIQDEKQHTQNRDSSGNGSEGNTDQVNLQVDEQVKRTTRALGPFIVPMINYLGALNEGDVAFFGQAGDEE